MSSVARVGLCGTLGGGVNAWLCYARLPVAVDDNPTFAWHLIPAGAVHGAVLALVPFAASNLLANRSVWIRLAAGPPLAWAAGFVAWTPLNRSAFDEPWLKSLGWAFHEGWTHALLGPLQYFGLVSLLFYLVLALPNHARSRPTHIGLAALSGIIGSLWWWVTVGPWYFSILHGGIWGALVGAGGWAERPKVGSSRVA
jgi:hypothetical protein